MNKIALVNRTNLKNYGSVLQVYALCRVIESFGFNVDVVWNAGNLSKNLDLRPWKILRTFVRLLIYPRLLLSTIKTIKEVKSHNISNEVSLRFETFVNANFRRRFLTYKELTRIARTDEYFKFVCGSDQIWSSTTMYVDPMMYLRFVPKEKRIAYAPSIGRDYIPNYNHNIMRKFINDIPHVSIREQKGQELIYNLIGTKVPVVLDPTLLLSSKEWDILKTDVDLPADYILCYFLDEPKSEVKSKIIEYAEKTGKDIVVLGTMNEVKSDIITVLNPSAGPGEFLTIISKSSLVITDSYHGMLFSLNYKKDFWAIEREYSQFNQSSRQLSILSTLGLEDRYMYDKYEFQNCPVDYSIVNIQLEELIAFSKQFLRTAINS